MRPVSWGSCRQIWKARKISAAAGLTLLSLCSGCGNHQPTVADKTDQQQTDTQAGMDITSGPIKINSRSTTGERLWKVEADSADANFSNQSSTGQLTGVRITIFQEDAPSMHLKAPSATRDRERYNLSQGVDVWSEDQKTRLHAGKVIGSLETDQLVASQQVRAEFSGAKLGPADSCVALLKSNKQKMNVTAISSLVLSSLVAQGTDIQLVDKAGDLHVSGASKLSVKGLEGNLISIHAEGSPVIADWQKSGLSIRANTLDGKLIRGDVFTLSEAELSGTVFVSLRAKDGTVTVGSPLAYYNRDARTLTFSDGVTLRSNRAKLPAELHTPKVIVHFKAESLKAGSYEIESVEALGANTTLISHLEKGTAKLTDVSSLQVWPETPSGFRFDANGSDLVVSFESLSLSVFPNWTSRAQHLSGTIDGVGTLQRLNGESRVTFELQGKSKSENWNVTANCGTLNYSRETSILKLGNGVKITGTHPALAGGGATLTGSRAELEFKKDTLEPSEIRFYGGLR